MPIDVDAVVIDILSLIEQKAGIRLSGKPSHSKDGLEYHSNCPWCGGRDRFLVTSQIGRYSCAIRSSGCGRYGDAIDFLRNYPYDDAMTYVEACDELGIDVDPAYRVFKYPAVQEDDSLAPPKKWQEMGVYILDRAEWALWNHPEGLKLVEYLRARGIKDEIIKKKRFGYLPLDPQTGKWYEAPLDGWGITPDMLSIKDQGRTHVKIGDGLLIPWFFRNQLLKLTVKRPFATQPPPYAQVFGSREVLYNADLVSSELPVMMVEGVIDALSVEQEAGDLITVVATDGASCTRLPRWIALMCKSAYVLQSFDVDSAGESGADEWLKLLPEGHAIRHEPFSHDPNDMLREGQDIRKWVQLGIHLHAVPAMPLEQSVTGKEADEDEREYSDESLSQKCIVCSLDAEQDSDFRYDPDGNLYCEKCHPDGAERETGTGSDTIPEEQEEIAIYVPMTFYYTPYTLPALPRARCPFELLHVSKDNRCTSAPCKGRPLQHGWCAEHAYVVELLNMGSTIGYARIEMAIDRNGYWAIGEGKANWEAYAVRHAKRQHSRVISAAKRIGEKLFLRPVA